MKNIPCFKIKLLPQDNIAKNLPKFLYADKEIGLRSKLGGLPDFIQGDDWPICQECKQKMSFYGQLDSLNDEYCIGDCGMIYIFVCFDCLETKAIIQSY